ncbi:hypothetical protein D1007_42758 [Hordeum vulgare]|nr:hypothetical protein D1007_42758 [Hordeum vulgare]
MFMARGEVDPPPAAKPSTTVMTTGQRGFTQMAAETIPQTAGHGGASCVHGSPRSAPDWSQPVATNGTYVSTMEGSVDWSQIEMAPMNDEEIDVPISEENMCSVLGINDEPEHRKTVSEAAMKACTADVDACVADIDDDLLADAALPVPDHIPEEDHFWYDKEHPMIEEGSLFRSMNKFKMLMRTFAIRGKFDIKIYQHDPGDLEPPRTALAPTKVNSGANEDMQDICIGSQEALFMEPNFSYVALLKGYIDINGGYETINIELIKKSGKICSKTIQIKNTINHVKTHVQGRESCSNDTDNGQTNDGGEPLLQLHQTKTGGINENNKTSHEKGVGAQFIMTSFLREYQRILDNIHANEDELDHNATHKKVSWKTFTTKYYIERQAHNLYNISIFRKFQIILNDVTRLQIREEESMKLYMVYQANNYYKQERRARLYLVQVDADRDDYSCICCKFEKDGILCCHILKVMLHLEVDKIPDKYIIDRWRKEGKKMNKPKAIPMKLDNDQLRYNVLGMKLMELDSNASKSQRKFEHLLSAMVRIQQDLIDMDMEGEDEVDEQGEQTEECSKSNRTIGTLTAMVQSGNSNSTVELLNPDKAHTKGRPRLMTIQERIKTKTFYKCSHCHDPTHTKRKCTNLDKVYEFPKKKRSRKANQTKTADAGRNYSGSGNNKRPSPATYLPI